MSRSPLQTCISSDVAKKYTLWIAEYNSKCNYAGSYDMWQYSSKGKISGISGNVDMNYCYKDFPAAIKNGGLNGYTKTVGLPVLETKGYKRGDETIGVLSYKELLMTAKKLGIITQGVDKNKKYGEGTEKATNQLLKKFGYKQNGIAGEKLIKLLHTEIDKKVK